jgi:hypothetical protein
MLEGCFILLYCANHVVIDLFAMLLDKKLSLGLLPGSAQQ